MDTSAATAGTVFTHAAPCVGCLGVLEDATLEAAAQRVRRDLDSGGYACSDYSLVASVLPSVLLRQFAMSCYAQSLITSGTSGTTGAADTGGAAGTGGAAARPPFVDPLGSRNLLDMPTLAKARLSAVLQTTLPGAVLRVDSSLKIAVAFTHPDNVAECGCLPAPADAKAVARKRKRRDVAPSTLSLATLRKALASVVADSRYAKTPPAEACVARLVDWGMAVPPANPASAAACGCTVHVQRGPLFVSGNYRKLARGLSQTPWFVEGQRRGDSSVSEHIGDVIAPLWGATEYVRGGRGVSGEGKEREGRWWRRRSRLLSGPLCDRVRLVSGGMIWEGVGGTGNVRPFIVFSSQPNCPTQLLSMITRCPPTHPHTHALPSRTPQSPPALAPAPALSPVLPRYKFHSAGREDIDVRMLGDGRPFVIELLDARHGAEVSSSSWEVVREAVGGVAASALATPPSMQHVQGVINEATDDVEVSGLSFVPSSVFQALKDGADSKRKNYCCVVALSKPATATQLAQLSAHKDLLVLQQTPVRVLHRRTQMVREKVSICAGRPGRGRGV